ncbi:MAG: hypothetical protein IPM54_36135 [Polyangiaceae bacterium]|nr:hypothetical protein [Polyangiaceae bacterium]
MPDAGCAVSFANNVFPILETKAKCSDAACHAPAAAQPPAMTPSDAAATLQVLLAHKFLEEEADAYIVPCDPMASKMMCNLKLDPAEGMNMYGKCAPTMPKVSALDAVDDAPLSLMELNTIAEWISCGAPDN